MQVKQQEIEAVEAKLERQNGLVAAFAVAVWCAPLLAVWYWIYQLNDTFAPIMLGISGAIIGLAVRFHGRGYMRSFGVIAFLAHALVVVAAFLIGLGLGEGQSLRAFILVGLYVVGAWSAAFLGRIGIPHEQHKAFYVLTEKVKHPTSKRFKNRWFVTLPIAVILCGLTLYISLVALTGFKMFKAAESQYISESQRRDELENRAIDVTSASLEPMSNYEAMRHAYAFFKGYLPSKKGHRYSKYPKSEYKTKRILSFLIEERSYTRAKFVLGRLTYNENGVLLIQQAANEGDIYAKIFIASEFGCYGDTQQATDLLNRLAKTTKDRSAQDEIYSILGASFEYVCADYEAPDFSLSYIRD